ncbi:metallophosphoesterase family protein [Deinococcus lacus]|uniref:Metallophosphoesterase family protein n=1 Tax=Deinococcus lacus TaxID=392561 RepID=A0ABW1Y9I1_9DEIO
MKLAFLSDIHANIHALLAAKRYLDMQGAEQVVVVGDLVGYGANPGAVIDFVQQQGWPAALGSSDMRVALSLAGERSRSGVSGQVLEWTKGMLLPEQLEFLRGLPTGGRLRTPVGRVRYFHGSPHDPEGRVNLMGSDDELRALLAEYPSKVTVVGGSHVPFVRRVDDSLLIDPGSVGLTLNHEPGADVVIVECVSGREPLVSMHKVEYDVTSAAFDVMAWDLPPVIAEVMRTGRME